MANYFRITAYYPKEDICFIMDAYGRFKDLYDFSSCMIDKGIKIVKARAEGRFDFGNIPKAPPEAVNFIVRACDKGEPIIKDNTIEVRGRRYSIRS